MYGGGGVEIYLYTFFNLGDKMGWVGNSTPRPIQPGKEIRYAFYGWFDEPQGQSGRVRKISPPTNIRSLDRPSVVSRYAD